MWGDDDDDNGGRFASRPNSGDDHGRGRRGGFRRGGTRGQGRGGATGGDNVMGRRQNRREGSRDRGDATMADRFGGDNFPRGGRDTEGARGRGHDGERGDGRKVEVERGGNRGGPFRQRYNDRQQAGQRGDRPRGRGQRGGHMDQNVAGSGREGYRTQENTRYIQLEDCGHYFEVEGLDKFLGLGIKSDGAEIFTKLSVKTCPRCEKPIQLSRRYSNLLRESSAIKPRIVEKLQDARNSNDDKHLLLKVSSAVMSAKETIRLLLPKSPLALSKYSLSSRFGRDLVESRKSSILDKLHELLQASTEELHRHTKSLPNVLVDQHANDLWNEMNRVTIMCDLAEVLRGGATEPTKVPKLLNILGRDMNMTLAHDLLNGIRTANGISHDTGSGLQIFKRTPRLSFDVTMWFTCAKGHPVSNHHLKKGACKDCDLEKDEQERARSEASAAVGRPRDNVPGQRNLGGQQDQRRRGRGRGRRGRGGRGGRRGGHQRIYVPCYA